MGHLQRDAAYGNLVEGHHHVDQIAERRHQEVAGDIQLRRGVVAERQLEAFVKVSCWFDRHSRFVTAQP
jgi:hypothetical protein